MVTVYSYCWAVAVGLCRVIQSFAALGASTHTPQTALIRGAGAGAPAADVQEVKFGAVVVVLWADLYRPALGRGGAEVQQKWYEEATG